MNNASGAGAIDCCPVQYGFVSSLNRAGALGAGSCEPKRRGPRLGTFRVVGCSRDGEVNERADPTDPKADFSQKLVSAEARRPPRIPATKSTFSNFLNFMRLPPLDLGLHPAKGGWVGVGFQPSRGDQLLLLGPRALARGDAARLMQAAQFESGRDRSSRRRSSERVIASVRPAEVQALPSAL